MVRYVVFALWATWTAGATADDNWPHWRGPNADGTAPNANPPSTWDGSTEKNIRWKAPIQGRGSATPIVWGQQVFVLSAEQTDRLARPEDRPKLQTAVPQRTSPPSHFFRFIVTSYDRETGTVLWQRVAAEAVPHEGHHETHSYAAGSPTTDGQRLYVSFGSFGIYCFDLDGNPIWTRQLGRLTTRLGWGEAVTAVVYNDNLLLNWDQERDSALYCLDARTGETKWKADRDEASTWTTPLVTRFGEQVQVIMNGTTRVRSHELESGRVLWSCGGMTVNPIPSVVRYGDDVIVMSGYRGSQAESIPLSSRGELGVESVKWRHQSGTPYVPSPVLAGEHLYFTGGNGNVLTVLEAGTGKPVRASERLVGARQFYASPIYAGGRIFFTDRDGVTVVIEPGPSLQVLATNSLGEAVDASPVAVGNQLFLRGEKFLYCMEELAER